MPLFFPPLAGGEIWRAPLDFARERKRRASHVVEPPLSLEADVDMHPSRARCLWPTDQVEVLQRSAEHLRDLPQLIPLHARHRIEIDPQLVGMVEIVRTHGMGMQLEAREIRHPEERGRIARHDFLGEPAGRKFQRDHVDPVGTRPRCALLVEEFAAHPVGISDEYVRSSAGRAKCAVSYDEVVACKVQLCVTRLWKQDLARIGNGYLTAAGRQNFSLILVGTYQL